MPSAVAASVSVTPFVPALVPMKRVCHTAPQQGNKRTALLRYGMTFSRQPPPSPNDYPPSVLLMRAVGDLPSRQIGYHVHAVTKSARGGTNEQSE